MDLIRHDLAADRAIRLHKPVADIEIENPLVIRQHGELCIRLADLLIHRFLDRLAPLRDAQQEDLAAGRFFLDGLEQGGGALDYLVGSGGGDVIRADEQHDHLRMDLIQRAVLHAPEGMVNPVPADAEIHGTEGTIFFLQHFGRPAGGERVSQENQFRIPRQQGLALRLVLFRINRIDFPIRSELGIGHLGRGREDGNRRGGFLSGGIFLNRVKEPPATLARLFSRTDDDTDRIPFFQTAQIVLEQRGEAVLLAKQLRLQLVIHVDLQDGSVREGFIAQIAVVDPDLARRVLRKRVRGNVATCHPLLVPQRGNVEKVKVARNAMARRVGFHVALLIQHSIRPRFFRVAQGGVALGLPHGTTGIPKKAPPRRRSLRHGRIPVNRDRFPRPVGLGKARGQGEQCNRQPEKSFSRPRVRNAFRHGGMRSKRENHKFL